MRETTSIRSPTVVGHSLRPMSLQCFIFTGSPDWFEFWNIHASLKQKEIRSNDHESAADPPSSHSRTPPPLNFIPASPPHHKRPIPPIRPEPHRLRLAGCGWHGAHARAPPRPSPPPPRSRAAATTLAATTDPALALPDATNRRGDEGRGRPRHPVLGPLQARPGRSEPVSAPTRAVSAARNLPRRPTNRRAEPTVSAVPTLHSPWHRAWARHEPARLRSARRPRAAAEQRRWGSLTARFCPCPCPCPRRSSTSRPGSARRGSPG
jgi:hypothetical protein